MEKNLEAENKINSVLDDIKNCKNKNNDGQTCAAKIINDGWQIKEDYPW